MRKVIIFDYDSIFTDDIGNTISRYSSLDSKRALSVNICKSRDYLSESMAGSADLTSGYDRLAKIVLLEPPVIPQRRFEFGVARDVFHHDG